uniref:FBD domain-containing protein n=1 Tax=Chenopodium quinoa TaxID=63459 RepID=A0A803NAD1_CHEQI
MVVCMAPEEEKMTRRSPLDFPILLRFIFDILSSIVKLIDPAYNRAKLKLSLLRPLSNVQHLTVNDLFLQELNHEELKDQLPVFCYLKCLELGFNEGSFWDSILLGFLNRSPVLETLVFPEGLTVYPHCQELASEQQFCRTALADVPTCCRYHL